MRNRSMKLLTTPEDTLLFDLSKDIIEVNDLSTDNLDILNTMLKELGNWNTEMNRFRQKTWQE